MVDLRTAARALKPETTPCTDEGEVDLATDATYRAFLLHGLWKLMELDYTKVEIDYSLKVDSTKERRILVELEETAEPWLEPSQVSYEIAGLGLYGRVTIRAKEGCSVEAATKNGNLKAMGDWWVRQNGYPEGFPYRICAHCDGAALTLKVVAGK